ISRNFLNDSDLVLTTSPTGRYGVVNERTGKIILEDVYKVIYTSDLQKANIIRCIKSSGQATIIDSFANVLIKGIAYVDDFENTYARVNKGGKLTYENDFIHKLYVNREKTLFPKRKEWQEGADVVCQEGKWGAIDIKGNWTIKPKYQFLQSYANGVFIAQKDSKWGVVTPDDELVIDFVYDELRYFRK
ncbi:MAG: WG repeat-containing protein, partial [Chloroflexia bacterium]|nr:WG repeat-containing protein [Chloroflexia bacterium]